MKRNQAIAVLAAGLAAAFVGGLPPATAQERAWPTRPVKIVVPQAAGGGTDALARLLAERLQTVFGQPFVVENRLGAGGNIGTAFVAQQPADGHTLLLTQNTHVTNVSFYAKLPYDPIKDFAPVSLIASVPFVMAVNSASPVKSVRDLIVHARANPGLLSYASGGVGTPHHLGAELFKSMAKIDMVHVPYKGSAPAVLALVSNEVSVSISAVNSMLPFIRNGRIRPLAVATATRSSFVPDLPTIAEAANLPGFEVNIWYAVLAPAGTPRTVIDRLNAEINKVMQDPQVVKDRLVPQGLEGIGTSPERLAEVMKADLVKDQKIARDAGIRPDMQ